MWYYSVSLGPSFFDNTIVGISVDMIHWRFTFLPLPTSNPLILFRWLWLFSRFHLRRHFTCCDDLEEIILAKLFIPCPPITEVLDWSKLLFVCIVAFSKAWWCPLWIPWYNHRQMRLMSDTHVCQLPRPQLLMWLVAWSHRLRQRYCHDGNHGSHNGRHNHILPQSSLLLLCCCSGFDEFPPWLQTRKVVLVLNNDGFWSYR